MKKIGLSDITQEDFDIAAAIVASGIKAYNRKLDTRQGTVLRDLLVNPEAAIESVTSGQIEEARKASSLKMLQESQDAGYDVDQEDVNSIMSNFNIVPNGGRRAKGTIKVVVSDGDMAYAVQEGAVFYTVDGVRFTVDNQTVAAPISMSIPPNTRTTTLYEGAAGFFFLVEATAEENGNSGNIQQGSSLTPESTIQSFVMAEAYKDFDGGSDVQSLDDVIKKIPSELSIRGFVNKTAVEGMLRSEFDGGDFPILAVSTVGYGDISQRRDKHNLFGVGVGGRIDVYVRNFGDLVTKTEMLIGTYVPDDDVTGKYIIDVPAGVFPGSCWIKSVSDPFSDEKSEDVISSFAIVDSVDAKITTSRTADVSGTWHDIDVSKGPAEAFNTVWQGFRIVLENVPDSIVQEDEQSSSGERIFKVTAWCLPQAVEIQKYVDRDDVRNVSTDVVVRCPMICNVSVDVVAKYDPKNPVDPEVARNAIRTYINSLGFVGKISRSEIVYVLKKIGVMYVDMGSNDMLSGSLHDANGVRRVLYGDTLDISDIEDGSAMLSKNTVIFAAEDRNIQVKLSAN